MFHLRSQTWIVLVILLACAGCRHTAPTEANPYPEPTEVVPDDVELADEDEENDDDRTDANEDDDRDEATKE